MLSLQYPVIQGGRSGITKHDTVVPETDVRCNIHISRHLVVQKTFHPLWYQAQLVQLTCEICMKQIDNRSNLKESMANFEVSQTGENGKKAISG